MNSSPRSQASDDFYSRNSNLVYAPFSSSFSYPSYVGRAFSNLPPSKPSSKILLQKRDKPPNQHD